MSPLRKLEDIPMQIRMIQIGTLAAAMLSPACLIVALAANYAPDATLAQDAAAIAEQPR